jgi:hypothetical protein
MINFGKYDQKCSFINFGSSPDGFGGSIPTESLVLSTFCRAIQIRGGSDIESLQLQLPNTYRIGVQVRSGFTPSEIYQIQYKGFNHKITGISLSDARQFKEWIITMIRA